MKGRSGAWACWRCSRVLPFHRRRLAQSTTGTIRGTVTRRAEGGGAGRHGDNAECRDERSPNSGQREDGFYRFLNVAVGEYELTIERGGFSTSVRSGITVSLNQDAVVDAQLQPAGFAETIEVRADAPLINTTTAEVGFRFDSDQDRRAAGAGRYVPRRVRPRALRAWRQRARQRPGTVRIRNELFRRTACGSARTTSRSTGRTATHRRSPDGSSRSTTPTSSRRSG